MAEVDHEPFDIREPRWAPWYNLIGRYSGVQVRDLEGTPEEYAVVSQRNREVLLAPASAPLLIKVEQTAQQDEMRRWWEVERQPDWPSIEELVELSVAFEGPGQLVPDNLRSLTLEPQPGWTRVTRPGGHYAAIIETADGRLTTFVAKDWTLFARAFEQPGCPLMEVCLEEAAAKDLELSEIVIRTLGMNLRSVINSRIAVLDFATHPSPFSK